jgi:hypothetical protein
MKLKIKIFVSDIKYGFDKLNKKYAFYESGCFNQI